MNEHEVQHVVEALETFTRRLETDGLYNEQHRASFERVASLLADQGLTTATADLMPVTLAAEDFLNRVVDTTEQAVGDGTTIATGNEEAADLARIRIEMSDIYYLLGNWDEALRRLTEALTMSQDTGDLAGQAKAYARIGRVQSRRTVWDEATEALQRALKLYQELQDAKGEAHTLLLLGNAAFLLGAYDKAYDLMQDGLKAAPEDADEIIGDINLSIGVVEQVRGHTDQAMDHYMESISRFEAIDDQRRMAPAYLNLGIIHMEREAWPMAGRYYEKSLTYARESGDLSMVGIIYLRRGEMQAKVADWKMALRYGRRAMEIFEQLNMTSGKADTYRLYGEIAAATDTPDDAQIFLAESRRLQQAAGSKLGEAEVAETEAELHAGEGDKMQATARYHYAMAQLQQLGVEGAHLKRLQDAVERLTR